MRAAYRSKILYAAFLVRLAVHVANGWKFLIHPSSGKDTAKTKGVPFTAMTVINAKG